MRALAPLALGLLLAGGAASAARPTDAERLQQRLGGLVPGPKASCLSLGPTVQSETYGNVIAYKSGATTYVNRFGGQCTLRPDFQTIVTNIPTNQLCRGDIAQIYDQTTHFPQGSCIFDDFETYTRPKKAK